MAFLVEDGTGLDNANSMSSVTEFDAYYTDRNVDISALSTTDKESLLIRGADYLSTVYSGSWVGELKVSTQSMPFPRILSDGTEIFPSAIKSANIQLALKANDGDLLTDVGQRVVEKKIDVITTKYSEYSDEQQSYTSVYNLVKPYLENSSIYSHSVTR